MIFLELVPRDLIVLKKDSNQYLLEFESIQGINIPDIKRLPHRSIDVAKELLKESMTVMPHIRTQDHAIKTHLYNIEELYSQGLKHILFITGDAYTSPFHDHHLVTPVELIKEVKKQFPKLNVYAGLDPYRQKTQIELDYANAKLDAGADGLFSQPFFDCNLARFYLNRFTHTQLFLGMSPVLTEKSKAYWEHTNHVIFPKEFNYTLDYNVNLAKELIKESKSFNQHVYLMPIKTDIRQYLSLIFS